MALANFSAPYLTTSVVGSPVSLSIRVSSDRAISSGVEIPTDAYLPTGLILIPINSALNPFLYSNLPDFLWSKFKQSRDWIQRSLLTRAS